MRFNSSGKVLIHTTLVYIQTSSASAHHREHLRNQTKRNKTIILSALLYFTLHYFRENETMIRD